MKWFVLVLLFAGCTSYTSARQGLREGSGDEFPGEEETDGGVQGEGEGRPLGSGNDAGALGQREDAGDLGAPDDEEVGDGQELDAGAPAPVDEPWYVGAWSVRLLKGIASPCGARQLWNVQVSSKGLAVDRGELGVAHLKRTAWGFEGQAPEGYYAIEFVELTNTLEGTMSPFGTQPYEGCASAIVLGERAGGAP